MSPNGDSPSHDLHLTLPRLANDQTEEFLTPKQAAGYLRVSKSYLEQLRVYGGGPRFLRFGRRFYTASVNSMFGRNSAPLGRQASTPSHSISPLETARLSVRVENTNEHEISDALLLNGPSCGTCSLFSTRSVRRWIAAGELLAHRFGRQVRISEVDLRAFMDWRRTNDAASRHKLSISDMLYRYSGILPMQSCSTFHGSIPEYHVLTAAGFPRPLLAPAGPKR